MRKFTLLFAVFIACFSLMKPVFAQERKFCGQAEELERMKVEEPGLYQQYLKDEAVLENFTKEYTAKESSSRGTVYIIPVVFHIIHDYGIENISNDQLYDAIRILNEDFRKLNADTSDIITPFKAIAGDSEIEFRLAQKDPSGNCTNGIIRVASSETYVGSVPSTSNVSRWPREKYMNVWVVNTISSGAAGFTNYPGVFHSNPSRDGIMILHNYVGSIGTGGYTRSRALSHEVGHWLNLRHTWGNSNNPGLESNCGSDDLVGDTPNTIGWTSCALNGATCDSSETDNVQNYMDYSYCTRMFTQGQSTRMRAAIESFTAQRNNLWTSANLTATGTDGTNQLCKADFIASKTEICIGESVDFTDYSYNNPSTWEWTFTGGVPSSSLDKNPTVVYDTPGKYNVQLTVTDGVSGISETKNEYITVLPASGIMPSFVEGFENTSFLPNNEWFINSPGTGVTWEVSNVGATGSKSVMIDNSNNEASFHELSSTTFDFSSLSAVYVSFKVAFAQKNSSNVDKLKFFISKDCGETWIERWSKSGNYLATVPAQTSEFVPDDPSHWTEFIVSNIKASHLVNNFKFKFQYIADGGNNMYIDDINVYDPATVGIKKEGSQPAANYVVFPNPFKDEATITVTLGKNEQVKISLMDLLGKESIIQPESNLTPGEYVYRINKSEMNLSRGIYFIKFSHGDKLSVKKIILN